MRANTGANDYFGFSVAVSGDTVVVAAPYEDSNATGVNGDQTNNSASDSGAAYVFVRSGTNWSQQAYLKASNTGLDDQFGTVVAVSGDTVMVAAPYEDSNATGVNGSQTNNSAPQSGAAYVFVRSGTNWSQQTYLKASNSEASDQFGISVAVSGDLAVIGANGEDSSATGVNGNQSNNSAGISGAAYAFKRSGTNWSQQAYLKASNTGAGDQFGISVAVSDGTVVIGANGEDSNATGIDGNQGNNSAGGAGAACIFAGFGPPEIAVEQPAGTDLADGSSTVDFGELPVGGGVQRTFTIRNTGIAALTGLGITFTGANAGEFTVTASPTAPVAPGGSTLFTVTFSPGSAGAKTAALHLLSNDSDESPFDIALTGTGPRVPEIVVEEPSGTSLGDGSSTVDFGAFLVGGGVQRAFTIRNTGNAALTGLGITITGANAGEFVVTASPTAPLAPGSNTTFTVTFSPGGAGARMAALHIASNDSDESPFDITLIGTAVPLVAEIVVEQPADTILGNGSSTVDFGSVPVGGSVKRAFAIRNTGNAALTGLGISITGANFNDFMVITHPTAPLGPGSNTTFTAAFSPGGTGARTAALHIASNDSDENPFDIALTGEATTPASEIAVQQPLGAELVDGAGSIDFGSVGVRGTNSLTLTIRNFGAANLTGLGITVDGPDAAMFSVTANPISPVAPGGSTTFTVSFAPTSQGPKTGALHIANNDADENPFDIALTGQMPITEAWVHRYNNTAGNSDDGAVKVVRDAAGDIIVTGTSYDGITGGDMLTIKYSGADGSLIWKTRYNGPANDYDRPTAMAVDASGNVVVAGFSYNGNVDDVDLGVDYYTAKYAAADGALLWERRYHDPTTTDGYDSANAVAVDGSGNVVVTGSSDADYYTAKYAAANGALLWEQRYNGPANSSDYANAVVVDGSGNVVVTGSSNADYYTAKYAAANGALLWEQRYNGPANSSDYANAVVVDASGNVVVTGASFNSSGNTDYYTAKYAAANGALLWEKRYNGPANSDDEAHAVAVDGSGNVVVTGISDADYYTAKYAAANGALLWGKRYNGPAYIYRANAVAVDGSGNVVMTGASFNTSGNTDYYTAKYAAANGALLWEKRFNGPFHGNDHAYAVAVDGSGNAVVTGYSYSSEINGDYYTAKYAAANGALLWEKRYNGPGISHDHPRAVAVDGSGNVIVTGSSEGDDYTAKYAAANGALLWEKRYTNGNAHAVAVDGSGNVVVMGSSFNGSYYDYYTVKYATTDGARLWEERYNGPVNDDGGNQSVAVDGSGNVVVTGLSDDDYYTAKYAAADGALLWEKYYNGPANSSDFSEAVVVDGSGNVVVTGSSFNSSENADYYTAKYAAANGALLWEKYYNGPEDSNDRANALAVDGRGNVVVTGGSYNSSENADYYTAKYAAADGALLWEKRYNGPEDSDDEAHTVVVDGSGNVVVTGYSYNSSGDTDYYTAKYAAADGALLWEKRYNGPENSDERANAVAVDGRGNVVVTGYSYNSSGNADYYTAKYAAADGALLWEKRYNGPANGNDVAVQLAIAPNGMVVVTGYSAGTGTGNDYATVVYRETLPPVAIALVPAGVRLRFIGESGHSYQVQRAPAVTGPWSALATLTAPASGLLEYLDTPPPGTTFYRTVQP